MSNRTVEQHLFHSMGRRLPPKMSRKKNPSLAAKSCESQLREQSKAPAFHTNPTKFPPKKRARLHQIHHTRRNQQEERPKKPLLSAGTKPKRSRTTTPKNRRGGRIRAARTSGGSS